MGRDPKRSPHSGAAWDKCPHPATAFLACMAGPLLPKRDDGRIRAHNVPAGEKRRVRQGPSLPRQGDGSIWARNVSRWEKCPHAARPALPRRDVGPLWAAHHPYLGEIPALVGAHLSQAGTMVKRERATSRLGRNSSLSDRNLGDRGATSLLGRDRPAQDPALGEPARRANAPTCRNAAALPSPNQPISPKPRRCAEMRPIPRSNSRRSPKAGR